MGSYNWKTNKVYRDKNKPSGPVSSGSKGSLPFTAMYKGTCLFCDERIELGDTIRKKGKSYAHDQCCVKIVENRKLVSDEYRDIPPPRPKSSRVERWVDLMGNEHFKVIDS